MVKWEIEYSKYAVKDAQKLHAAGLKGKAQKLLDVLAKDPLQNPPPFEKLVGDLSGAYSRRINIQHRVSATVCNLAVRLLCRQISLSVLEKVLKNSLIRHTYSGRKIDLLNLCQRG